MKTRSTIDNRNASTVGKRGEEGSAIVIALFVLALISVFVALAMSRSSAEAAATGNETAEARTFYAAQASLETMTRNFNKVFEVKLNPTAADLNNVRTGTVAGLGTYTFFQELDELPTAPADRVKNLEIGPFAGLYALRDNWRIRTTATSNNGTTASPVGTQVQLTRNVLNNRIPIFQFGIFYNDDLELFRPPRFSFGGRVHSNGNFFISPGSEGVYFDSRVTAADQIVTQTWRNWDQVDSTNNETWIKNASGTFVRLQPTMGSVLNTTLGAANNIFQFPPSVPVPAQTPNPDLPPSRVNPTWASQSAVFDGNLRAQVPALKLPLNVGYPTDLVEMVRRGKEVATSSGGDLANIGGVLGPVTAASQDDGILRSERFTNKTGIRISLADSQAKLPGCASGVGITPVAASMKCGIRLDGRIDGSGTEMNVSPTPTPTPERVRGYQPLPMKKSVSDTNFTNDPYVATRLNGERFYTGGTAVGREVWIKVEFMRTNVATGSILATDITEDFLSMGVTEPARRIMDGSTVKFQITDNRYQAGTWDSLYDFDGQIDPTAIGPTSAQTPTRQDIDNRSVIKLQRFVIPGKPIPTPSTTPTKYTTSVAVGSDENDGFNVVQRFTQGSGTVSAYQTILTAGCRDTTITTTSPGQMTSAPYGTSCGTKTNTEGGLEITQATPDDRYTENIAHLKLATVNGNTKTAVVPFPIEMFDAREGYYYDERSTTYYSNLTRLPVNGVMSMVDIDIANLRRFLRGDFNGLFPTTTKFAISKGGVGLVNSDIPVENGWVLHISDRRGDADFDGEYDMEDIYGNAPGNNGSTDPGEDVNHNGSLQAKYMDYSGTTPWLDLTGCASGTECEAARYNFVAPPDFSAVVEHKFYRRGVRLTNATVIPGIYDATTPANTRGFTVASENGIYTLGNYNATGANTPPSVGNTPYDGYQPFNTANHIPASIVADGVTVLSNAWNDGQSFSTPITDTDQSGRVAAATTIRFAMIAGDTIASKEASPNQGGSYQRLNGGVHNFKRYLERWTNKRLDYAGSLINLFNSHNNNGAFKCCNTVYNPPIRNWVFDSTFLDPARLPPGTPFFQYVQTTGFLRTND